jgi:hypothetical protein
MAFGDFTVVRSTVKNVLNSSGVLASVAVNTPAFEFNADGSYKGLLVEPGATNLALRSQDFGNAAWTLINGTIVSTNELAPDGTMTATRVQVSGAGDMTIRQNIGGIGGGVSTVLSLFIKQGNVGGQAFILDIGDAISDQQFPTTEWVRYEDSTAWNAGSAWIDLQFFGTGGVGEFLIWGAQLETGSVATSYIPTVASTVARTADEITLSSASSLIGQTEGTVYIEAETRIGGSGQRLFEINDATSDNRITCIVESNFTISTVVTVGGVGTASYTGATESNTIKVALAYANNDIATYVNGVANGTDTSSTIPATSAVYLGSTLASAYLNGWIKSFALFPTRLSNSQLSALTTL